MKIVIDYLNIHRFKGVLEHKLEFDEVETKIIGDNGLSKTTTASAFFFLLTGKDENQMSELRYFKPIDKDGNIKYPKDNYYVEGGFKVYDNDGGYVYHRLKRSFKQKFVKPRGQSEEVVSGHITEYEINLMPVSLSQFETYISSNFGNVEELLLCSNINYFASLTPDKQRELLFTILPSVSDDSIYSYMSNHYKTSDYSINKLKELIACKEDFNLERSKSKAKINKLKKELDVLPAKIEATNAIRPNLSEVELDKVDSDVVLARDRIKRIEQDIAKESKVDVDTNKDLFKERKRTAILTEIGAFKNKVLSDYNNQREMLLEKSKNAKSQLTITEANIVKTNSIIDSIISKLNYTEKLNELVEEVSNYKTQLSKETSLIEMNTNLIKDYESDIENVDKELSNLRKEIENVAKLEFETKFKLNVGDSCPTCGNIITEEKVNEHNEADRKAFNDKRRKDVDQLNLKGGHKSKEKVNINAKIILVKKDIDNTRNRIKALEEKIKNNNSLIAEIKESKSTLVADIDKIKLNTYVVGSNTTELMIKLNNAYRSLDKGNALLEQQKADLSMLDSLIEDNELSYKDNIDPSKNSSLKKLTDDLAKLDEVVEDNSVEESVNPELERLNKEKVDANNALEKALSIVALVKSDKEAISKIEEYKDRMKTLSSEIAEIENYIKMLENYDKSKVRLIEESIPTYFNYVGFELFELLSNGEYRECCNIVVDGVNYNKALNTASKAWAGIEIVQAFQRKNNLYAPIFIDNKESISTLPRIDSQYILLEKVAGQHVLKVVK